MADSHLSAVPDLPDEDMFTTVPVCPTCPPHRTGFRVVQRETDWDVSVWHLEPCPRAREVTTEARLVPGCETCHTWAGADMQLSDLVLPDLWTFHPKHGRAPITSRDGTLQTAAGGDYCPMMEPDNARFERVAARSARAAQDGET